MTRSFTAEKMEALLPSSSNKSIAHIVALISQLEKDLQSQPVQNSSQSHSKWKWSYR